MFENEGNANVNSSNMTTCINSIVNTVLTSGSVQYIDSCLMMASCGP
jgi:hypothetical protein